MSRTPSSRSRWYLDGPALIGAGPTRPAARPASDDRRVSEHVAAHRVARGFAAGSDTLPPGWLTADRANDMIKKLLTALASRVGSLEIRWSPEGWPSRSRLPGCRAPRRLVWCRLGGTAGGAVLREDAHPARPYQEPDDDKNDAPQELLAHDRNNSGDDQDDGENPQQHCHDLHLQSTGLGPQVYPGSPGSHALSGACSTGGFAAASALSWLIRLVSDDCVE